MVGHSMGSLAARAYAAEHGDTLDGLLLSGSPGYNAACGMGKALTWVLQGAHLGNDRARSKLMDAMLNGPFEKNFQGDSHFLWLSADRDNVRAYENDPQCGFGFTLNGYRALLTLMQRAYDEKTRLPETLPVRFMSGEDDPMRPRPYGLRYGQREYRKTRPEKCRSQDVSRPPPRDLQ